jgi:hypothetical protein
MPKNPLKKVKNEGQRIADLNPVGGDAILKRMLQAKPKTHDEMVEERHAQVKRKRKTKAK